MQYANLLEEKWGKLVPEGHCLLNGQMPFVSTKARLNMLFLPEEQAVLSERISKICDCTIPEQLKAFYSQFNGCRLFFSSLNVFGVQAHPAEIYEPFDLWIENNHILGNLSPKDRKKCDVVFFASIGGEYVFGFDKVNPSRVYGYKKGSLVCVQEFPDFDSFFDFHFNRLINEYDEACRKKHPLKQYIGIPALEHLTTTIE